MELLMKGQIMKKVFFCYVALTSYLLGTDMPEETKNLWSNTTPQTAIDALGIEVSLPITNGFVFIDGGYISPPYVVKREGNGVLINNRLIEERIPWPIAETEPSDEIIASLPSLPNSITVSSSQDDKDVQNYIGLAISYFLSNSEMDEIALRMKPIYESLPCVEKVLPGDDSESLRVFWRNGDNADGKILTQLSVFSSRMADEWTPALIINDCNFLKNIYAEGLQRGDFYFFPTIYSRSNRTTGTKEGAVNILLNLIPILETSQNEEEVFTQMTTLNIIRFTEGDAKAFFENRSSITPELKQRLEALKDTLVSQHKSIPMPKPPFEIPPPPQQPKPTVINLKMY